MKKTGIAVLAAAAALCLALMGMEGTVLAAEQQPRLAEMFDEADLFAPQEEADLLAQLISKGARVSSYRREEGNLEELFLRLTEGEDHNAGKPIREKDSY